MTTFRRAHSPEQREVRRSAILDTATQMLQEMPASSITLNALSRRACMAKSNVLRYFDSREAVLLELFNAHLGAWIDALATELSSVDPSAAVDERVRELVTTLVESLAQRPVLCDLMAAQASELEHNISNAAVLEYKRASIANIDRLVDLVAAALPELGADGAAKFTALAAMLGASVWTHSHPPAAVVAAYEADPAIACYRMEFTATLQDSLQIVLAGLLTSAP